MDISNSQFPYAPPQQSQGIVKRRRNRHACDPCRRKRAKCDGNLPCHGCVASEAECTYTAPKKRGVPTGFLQKLETSNEKLVSLVSLLIEELDDGYDIISKTATRVAQESAGETRERYTKSRAHILGLLEVEDFEEMPVRNGKCKTQVKVNDSDNGSSNEFARFDEKLISPVTTIPSTSSNTSNNTSINTPAQPNPLPLPLSTTLSNVSNVNSIPTTTTLSANTTTTDTDNGSIVPLDDDVKHEDVPIPAEPDAPENPAAASSEVRFLGPSSGFDESFYASFERLRLTQARFDVSAWKSIISSYSVMDLLDTYFAYIHPLFPMVEKSKLVQIMYSSDATKKNGKNCLLWSTIMMGLNLTNVGTPKQDSFRSRIMHDLTICTLDCKYSLESVQAMLIQGFYFYGKGHWSNSYLIIGNAVRMANVVGLHLNEQDTISRRTWKCCCIIDTLISGRLGRQSLVSIDNFFTSPEPETSEEWELWKQPSEYVRTPPDILSDRPSPSNATAEPARTLSIFNQYHELVKLINSLICETNSPRYSKYSLQEKNSLLSRVSYQLDDWAMNMPVHCSFIEYTDPSTSNSNQLLPHKANLLLCFFAFTTNLHLMDNNDTLRDCKNILLPETVVNFASNVFSCYFGRYGPGKTLPTFEYYICLSLSLFMKTIVQVEMKSVDQMTDSDEFTNLLGYLEEISVPWAGAALGCNYFSKMKVDNEILTSNPTTNTELQDQYSTSPFSASDLAEIDSFEILQQTLMPSGFQYNPKHYGPF